MKPHSKVARMGTRSRVGLSHDDPPISHAVLDHLDRDIPKKAPEAAAIARPTAITHLPNVLTGTYSEITPRTVDSGTPYGGGTLII
jgi:hypothetical protein